MEVGGEFLDEEREDGLESFAGIDLCLGRGNLLVRDDDVGHVRWERTGDETRRDEKGREEKRKKGRVRIGRDQRSTASLAYRVQYRL